MIADSVDDLHQAEDFAGTAVMTVGQLADALDVELLRAGGMSDAADAAEAALKNAAYVIDAWSAYCRPTCQANGVHADCQDDDPDCCGCPCDHGTPTAEEAVASGLVCEKCDQDVVKQGWFWMLPDEVGTGRIAFCPEGGVHEVEEDET